MKKLLPEVVVVCAILMVVSYGYAQTWTQTVAPSTNWMSIACSADGTKLAAVVYYPPDPRLAPASPIYVSTNSGVTWTPIEPFYNSLNWGNIASSADGTKLIVSSTDGPLYTSTDSGIFWTEIVSSSGDLGNNFPLNYWADVASSADGNKLVAAGFYGDTSIYVSTNSGATWATTTASQTGQGWSSVASSADGSHLAAATVFDSIYVSTNSGISWMPTTAPLAIWQSIASSSDGKKLVAAAYNNGYGGYPGSIYTSIDSGMTWMVTSAPSNSWFSVASSADGNMLVAAISGGLIYTSTNSGSSWNAADAPSTNWQFVACSADGNKLFAGVKGGGIWTSRTTPLPQLDLMPSTTNLVLSWLIPSTNFIVQQSPDLVSWSSVTDAPVLNLTNLNKKLSLSPTNSSGFFRLMSQ